MRWKKKKPTKSGWYQYLGDLYPIGEKRERTHCDPACRVAMHSGEEPFIAIYQDTDFMITMAPMGCGQATRRDWSTLPQESCPMNEVRTDRL